LPTVFKQNISSKSQDRIVDFFAHEFKRNMKFGLPFFWFQFRGEDNFRLARALNIAETDYVELLSLGGFFTHDGKSKFKDFFKK